MNHSRKKALSVLLTITLMVLLFPVYGESSTWDCPECGRTGNTGNYCGGCAHPAPWIEESLTPTSVQSTIPPTLEPTSTPEPSPLNISSIKYRGSGEVTVNWSGGQHGNAKIVAYHYFNDEHNAGIENNYEIRVENNGAKDNTSINSCFIPGQRYWFKIWDNYGDEYWYDYTVPVSETRKIELSITGIKYMLHRTKNSCTDEISVNGFSASKIESALLSKNTSGRYGGDGDVYGIVSKLKIKNTSGAKDINFMWAYKLPNGDVIPGYWWGYNIENGLTEAYLDGPWLRIYNTYQCIPTGNYEFILIADEQVVGSKKFKVGK